MLKSNRKKSLLKLLVVVPISSLRSKSQKISRLAGRPIPNSGLPKVIFLAVAEAEGEGGKTSALEVEAEGEAEGLVFCI